MVSRGNLNIVRHSVNCFLQQTYGNRELVIVSQAVSNDLRAFVDSISSPSSPIEVHHASPDLSLGDLRNMSIARSRGDLICQWDDDDLHHPRYLDWMVAFTLANKVGAAFLRQCTIWWPAKKMVSHSIRRIWENTMIARRPFIPIYPNLARSEDTYIAQSMARICPYAMVNAPYLYIYVVTGKNTWNEQHMQRMMSDESDALSGADYDAVFDRMDCVYKIRDYERYCLRPNSSE
jgi:glycosyltransferase involved in cell wall biosynthesis